MARVLFVVPPLAGHVNPTVPVASELTRRGHDVAWTGHPDVVPDLLPRDAGFIPVDHHVPASILRAVSAQQAAGKRGPAALKFLWEEFLLPLGRTMATGVRRAVDAFAPDALVVDQQAVAGAAVAQAAGLPWITSATTSAELTDPFRTMPKVGEWVRELLCGFQADVGMNGAASPTIDLRFSPHLVLVFSTRELAGDLPALAHMAGPTRFVGPSFGSRPDAPPFDWEWLDPDRPLVLVSLGTLNWAVGRRFFGIVAETVSTMDVQGVLVAPPGLVDDPPPNVVVMAPVPQLGLLGRAAAVICHGGHNTVCEALAHGVPLVVAPIRDDQPIVAEQVVGAGAGVRVRFGRVGADGLRAALEQVLWDPEVRAGAARVRRSFERAGGPAAAVDHIEEVLHA